MSQTSAKLNELEEEREKSWLKIKSSLKEATIEMFVEEWMGGEIRARA